MWLPEGKARTAALWSLAETSERQGRDRILASSNSTGEVTLKYPGRFEASLPVRLVLN
jgi:hypothetical protein